MSLLQKSNGHRWNFFRAGGFDQVRIESAGDIARLDELDQKLWVALACPTTGLEFDGRTLALIDTDKDGRIRAPEIIAAAKWVTGLLKNPDELLAGSGSLPLSSINDATAEGKQLLASARQILVNLGKGGGEGDAISVDDTIDTARIFAQTRFNGDGIIPADAAEDAGVKKVIEEIISVLGAETDRSGKPGISGAKLEQFFKEARAYAEWNAKVELDAALRPLGDKTLAAAETLTKVKGKVDDYFARTRIASFDVRATAALNRAEADYLNMSAKDLNLTSAEIAALPLARIEPAEPLPLDGSVNPAWAEGIEALKREVITPLFGERSALSEGEWKGLVSKFGPVFGWLATKPATAVEKLGIGRVKEILAGGAEKGIGELIAKDKALEPEANSIAAVEKLVRLYRDFFHLLNNFVAFRDFYARKGKAVFQAGTLYLDQRSCDLCVRVEDAGKHALMAPLSYTYLAYCDLVRKATGEKMQVACAFTAGDSDNLMVGRNGVFYDRQGRDWDATITKIVEQPISIRQAFWSPYKRLVRWIQEQIAKRAAAADAASQSRLQSAATTVDTAVTSPGTTPPPAPKKVDVGVVAALSVAAGALTTAFGYLLGWLGAVPLLLIPIYVFAVMLLISTPSMILAAIKLRQRNLGPILDANGWAVNARARINIPFGGSLTQVPKLPVGSHRDLVDPFAEKHTWRNRLIVAAVVVVAVLACWYFGLIEKILPNVFPKSPYVMRVEEQEKERTAREQADREAAARAATTQAAATQAAGTQAGK